MESAVGPGLGVSGVPLRPEIVLNSLRPHCMATMLQLEGILGEGDMAIIDTTRGLATHRTAAVRQLEATLVGYNSALCGIISSAGAVPTAGIQRAMAPTLPFAMLPLQVALSPAKSTSPVQRGSDRGDVAGGGSSRDVKRGGQMTGGTSRSAGSGGKLPFGVREKALLCAATAVRGSGSLFVKGYEVNPTFNFLLGLIFTLSECSPTTQFPPAASDDSNTEDDGRHGGGGGGGGGGCDGRSADGSGRGSGLSAGTDALRLACLECLEALLRAPFESHSTASSTTQLPPPIVTVTDDWLEVRDTLKTAVGGGLLAQLTQELLLCCQMSGGGVGGKGGMRVGASRTAVACLDGLCDFLDDAETWRRFLPGTFSGLFRAIRGMGAEFDSSQAGSTAGSFGSPPALTAIASPATAVCRAGDGRDRGGGGGGSKSALAEICLATLGKVLLLCARAEPATTANTHGARPPAQRRPALGATPKGEATTAGAGVLKQQDVNAGNDEVIGSDYPLAMLQRLASASNSKAGTDAGGLPPGMSNSETYSASSGLSSSGSSAGTALSKVPDDDTSSGRAATWEDEARGRLRLLLPPLLAFCRLHPGWRVRRAAARFASSLLGVVGSGVGHWAGNMNSFAHGDEAGIGRGVSSDGSFAAAVRDESVDMRARRRGASGGDGLLEPLMPLLMEALVGLALDGFPQVSTAAKDGLSSFRASLSPSRWVEQRGLLLERLCEIAEGLPALARSADEKRLRGAFDLLAGYLSLLEGDSRAALDARLPAVISCLCEALEFDQDLNVQVLEASHSRRAPGSRGEGAGGVEGRGDASPRDAHPKYYRQVLANAREDATLASARRAVRLLGTFCDIPSLADAALSSLEIPYPRYRRTRSAGVRVTANRTGGVGIGENGHRPQLALSSKDTDAANERSNETLHRRRCLQWLRPRLPMAWILNQTFLGQLPSPTAAPAEVGGESDGVEPFVGRGLAMAWLDRLLGSQAFSLPVSRAETMADGYSSYGFETYGSEAQVGTGLMVGRVTGAVGYTRSGEVLGAAGGGRSPGVSGQVLDTNATMVSLVVETLASLAEACGPDVGEPFLRRALYPLLEKAASTHPIVSQAAVATLSRLTRACGDFDDMSQLLAANMDYVVDDVVRRVKSTGASPAALCRRNEGGGREDGIPGPVVAYGRGGGRSDVNTGGAGIPGVVEAVLRIGGSAMGPALMKDLAGVTLREVDACAWDSSHSSRSIGVLRAVVSCVSITPSTSTTIIGGMGEKGGDCKKEGGSGCAAKSDDPQKGHSQRVLDQDPGKEGGSFVSEAVSGLEESPWFRELFMSFADASDVLRTTQQGGPVATGLLDELQRYRQERGFEDVEGEAEVEKVSADKRDSQEEGALPDSDAELRKVAESPEVVTLAEVLTRSCYFLSTPVLETQASALACMRDCVLKLATAGADAALPHVHRMWRPLMASFREFLSPRSTSSFALARAGEMAGVSATMGKDRNDVPLESATARGVILLHALDTVDALVSICGDFLSSKVNDDLWPLLKVLLLQYISQNAERHSGGGSRRARSTTLSLASSRQKDPFTITGSPNPSPNSTGNLSITETGSLLLPPMSDVSGAALGSGLSSIAPTAGSPAISTLLRGGGDRAGVGAGGATRGGLLEAKIVARALGCLEGLCRSPECKVFMGPLAREVALVALPSLSSATPETVRLSAESLFDALLFLDGDGVWLLLTQTLDTAGVLQLSPHHDPQNSVGVNGGCGGEGGGVGRATEREINQSSKAFVRMPWELDDREAGLRVARGVDEGHAGARGQTEDETGYAGAETEAKKASMRKARHGLFVPFPPPTALASWVESGRPCPLLERRSVFVDSVAKECAPAAARLLKLVNAGAAAERM